MNILRKIFGVIWILFAIVCAYFLITFGVPKFTSGTQEGIVFGIIILFILMPLTVAGLAVFGYYSVMGEYDENKMVDKIIEKRRLDWKKNEKQKIGRIEIMKKLKH